MKINIDNYELYFLRYIEGRLSDEERREVETFLIKHPDLKEIMDMYDPFFTLAKDEELVFDDKDSLMRPTKSSFVMPLWVRYASVAAVALFVVSVGLVWMQRQQPTQNIVLADNAIDIDIIEEKYVPMISDSIIDGEKLEEVMSTTRNAMHKDVQSETMLLAQAESEPMENEQSSVEIAEEPINMDTATYMHEDLDEETFYAMNTEEDILDIEDQNEDTDVYLEEYSNSLIAYNVGRATENTMDDFDTIYCEYTDLDIAEPMPLLEQFKEMFTTLFRDKKSKVESDLIEYADYVKLAYQEKKEEISMFITSRVEKIF
ncbi:MAG: hypothetical protein J6V54_01210 [Bacteroidales bacterium]|nr:hypothetical protein [Bacteroidales bacterium]